MARRKDHQTEYSIGFELPLTLAVRHHLFIKKDTGWHMTLIQKMMHFAQVEQFMIPSSTKKPAQFNVIKLPANMTQDIGQIGQILVRVQAVVQESIKRIPVPHRHSFTLFAKPGSAIHEDHRLCQHRRQGSQRTDQLHFGGMGMGRQIAADNFGLMGQRDESSRKNGPNEIVSHLLIKDKPFRKYEVIISRVAFSSCQIEETPLPVWSATLAALFGPFRFVSD